jgi:acetylcholinesterase
VGAGAYRQGE